MATAPLDLDADLFDAFPFPVTPMQSRILRSAHHNGVRSLRDLLTHCETEVSYWRNIGAVALAELNDFLGQHGLALDAAPDHVCLRGWRSAIRAAATVSELPLRQIESPPEPGIERARWLGDAITRVTGIQSPNLEAHAKRRAAARRVLARLAGYEPSRPDEDALYMASGSVMLAGLNEYARRVLDQGEASREDGTDHAVL